MVGEIEEVIAAEDFPEVNASEQLVQALPEQFPADPISPKIETTTFSKEETETRAKEKEKTADGEKKGRLETTLMSALVISSVVAAAIGVAFLISKIKKT
ncbi:hypothetical protein IEQ34_005406 [Dendrobium chrysotoxum]|uniref:Uncharacterized protein n=1 Tax=Dendrobium chrysotoxum TaxID=161865 RepID=A0AAV7HCZ0_DENCH|nr:hypothetical protein IEQ34_005406 [Dendrobium chrysotoxum]